MPYKDPKKQKEHAKKYYKEHSHTLREYKKKHYWNNPDLLREKSSQYKQNRLSTWEGFFPKVTQCQMCNVDIFFNARNKEKSIHFDHRHGGTEPINTPGLWLIRNLRTPKNEEIWKSCDFGMLCDKCNRRLPTKNRQQFKENINRYIK